MSPENLKLLRRKTSICQEIKRKRTGINLILSHLTGLNAGIQLAERLNKPTSLLEKIAEKQLEAMQLLLLEIVEFEAEMMQLTENLETKSES